jgi:hypothetical protein
MAESRSVNLVVNLPADLADEVEQISKTDPEFIEKVLAYGLVRRAVFARLAATVPWQRPATTPLEAPLSSSVEVS